MAKNGDCSFMQQPTAALLNIASYQYKTIDNRDEEEEEEKCFVAAICLGIDV